MRIDHIRDNNNTFSYTKERSVSEVHYLIQIKVCL